MGVGISNSEIDAALVSAGVPLDGDCVTSLSCDVGTVCDTVEVSAQVDVVDDWNWDDFVTFEIYPGVCVGGNSV